MALLIRACGDQIADDLYFTHDLHFTLDDRQLVCGAPIDDYLNPLDGTASSAGSRLPSSARGS